MSDRADVNLWTGDLGGREPNVSLQLEYEGTATREILDFARAIAVRGNLSIGSAIEPDIVALVNTANDPRIRQRWPNAIELKTQAEFDEWVRKHIETSEDESR